MLSYAEVKALCAGDDRIKEKMDLEVEVAKLRLLKSEYQSTQYQLEDRLLKRYPEQIKKKEAQIAGIKADQKTAEQHPKSENVFCGIEVFGKEYTDKRIQCLSPAKKYKLYKSSINKSIHFVQRSLNSSPRGQRG